MRSILKRLHDLTGKCERLVAVVWNPQLEQAVRESHNAEADLSVALGGGFAFGNRVCVEVYHVVQKPHSRWNHF